MSPRTCTPAPVAANGTTAHRFARQALIYGDDGQAQFAASTVGIIGLGGGGSLLSNQHALIARRGASLVHVDPETIDVTNLPRVIGANRWDAGELFARWLPKELRQRLARPKVQIARASPGATTQGARSPRFTRPSATPTRSRP